MKTHFLELRNATILSRDMQRKINGKVGIDIPAAVDLTLCGCACNGAVTGPAYCGRYIHCPQDYTC